MILRSFVLRLLLITIMIDIVIIVVVVVVIQLQVDRAPDDVATDIDRELEQLFICICMLCLPGKRPAPSAFICILSALQRYN